MLSPSSTPIPDIRCRFADKSFILPASTVGFRQLRPLTIFSSAYTSVSTGKESAAPNSFNSSSGLKLTASLYEVLGISIEATRKDIKTAYRRLARINHPDVTTSIDRKSSSAEEFMKIHDAYSTLSDPDKRASYDRRLFIISQRLQYSRSQPQYSQASPKRSRFSSGYTRRNWETDQCW